MEEEETPEEVGVGQPIFSIILFGGMTIGLSDRFGKHLIQQSQLSEWAVLEKLLVGKTTLAMQINSISLHPSGVVASICTHNFKQIVDPNGIMEKLPPFMEFFLKTHKLRNGDSQCELCSQHAQQIGDDVVARAEEQRAEGIENPDHEAIFLELFGKVKKREQISGTGQATNIYFPLDTYSFVGSALVNASQPGQ